MFQVPAVSIGMTMSFSVVGLTFYLPDGNDNAVDDAGLDADPPPLNLIQTANATDASGMDAAFHLVPDPTMTIDEDQASWFGNF